MATFDRLPACLDLSYLPLLFFSLASILSASTMAQDYAGTSLDNTSPTQTLDYDPYPTATIPPHSDNAGDSSNDDDGGSTDNGVVNYYFLLLAIFVILVAVSYCFLVRRRRRRLVLLRTNRQDALERDLQGWQGGSFWGHGRWRTTHDTRPEEGLDERGLPPPPYIPAPKPTHPGSSHNDGTREPAIPLQDMHNTDQKPPDYSERTVDSRDPTTTGTNRPSGHNLP